MRGPRGITVFVAAAWAVAAACCGAPAPALPDGDGGETGAFEDAAGDGLGIAVDALDAATEAGPPPDVSEPPPEEDDPTAPLFDPLAKPVPAYGITLSPEAIAALEAAPGETVPGGIALLDLSGAGNPLPAQVRLAGEGDLFRPLGKKASFDVTLDGGATISGLASFAFRSQVRDPARIHELLASVVFREAGVPSPRVAYARIRVNGEDYGLYAHVESPDARFLAEHFDGTTTFAEPEAGSDLPAALLDLAASTPDEAWIDAIGAVADLGEMTRAWAVERLLGHAAGYSGGGAGWLLHADGGGVHAVVPWETDLTFEDALDLHEGAGFLFARCLEVPACLALYDGAVADVLDALGDLDLVAAGAVVAGHAAPRVKQDPKREHGYGDFARSVQATLTWIGARTSCLEDPAGCPPPAPETEEPAGPAETAACLERFRGDHRYLVCLGEASWADARAACQGAGSDLAVLDDPAEAAWALQTVQAVTGRSLWVGLSDLDVEGDFAWVDGKKPGFAAWNPGEPNDWGEGEDCAELQPSGGWNDLPCHWTLPALCEDPCLPGEDQDGDGALRCGADCDDASASFHPGAADVCGDGLDQDCSGHPDDALDCPITCVEATAQGVPFALCGPPRSFADARALCLSRGEDLAWFTSLGQQMELRARLAPLLPPGSAGGEPAWIGLTSGQLPPITQAFVWLEGSAPDFDGWAEGQPGGGGKCARLRADALWATSPCSLHLPALCRSPRVE